MNQLSKNREPLHPAAFRALPLGAIKLTGWLRDQLRVQAAGLTGHLDEFWPAVVSNNGWPGGPGDPWERGLYSTDHVPIKLHVNARKLPEWALADHSARDITGGP